MHFLTSFFSDFLGPGIMLGLDGCTTSVSLSDSFCGHSKAGTAAISRNTHLLLECTLQGNASRPDTLLDETVVLQTAAFVQPHRSNKFSDDVRTGAFRFVLADKFIQKSLTGHAVLIRAFCYAVDWKSPTSFILRDEIGIVRYVPGPSPEWPKTPNRSILCITPTCTYMYPII